jgi:pseudouridylate synthase
MLSTIPRVALETTLLIHGVPRHAALALHHRLCDIVRTHGSAPALCGIFHGQPIVGMTDDQLRILLDAEPKEVPKANASNLGVAIARGLHAATTSSTTMELAARVGVSVFATGGLGGVHPTPPGHPPRFDISADLFALTRFPVAVVTSGTKSILDLAATREVLEALGIPVVGVQTDDFPAFYMRKSPDLPVGKVDARFDDFTQLAIFVRKELARTGRGIVVCNPIPPEHEISEPDWKRWLRLAEDRVAAQPSVSGRDVTPALLAALHDISAGATLRANTALVEHNVKVASLLASAMSATSR